MNEFMPARWRMEKGARRLAEAIGLPDYDLERAAADFRRYLAACPEQPYPRWDDRSGSARTAWQNHCRAMTQQSGSGNPLSPLIVVGSELSAHPDNYRELYFKSCFDLFWREVFGLPGDQGRRQELREDFYHHWGGAGSRDREAGGPQAPFYQSLRQALRDAPRLWQQAPFVFRHTPYHSGGNRGGGHQWSKMAALLKLLLKEQLPTAPRLAAHGSPHEPWNPERFHRTTIDDFLFLTEASLEAAPAGRGKRGNPRWNGFWDYALHHFTQPRIFLFNPTVKNNLQDTLRQYLFTQTACQIISQEDLSQEDLAGRYSRRFLTMFRRRPLTVFRFGGRHLGIFSPLNLTQAVPGYLLVEMCKMLLLLCKRKKDFFQISIRNNELNFRT